MRVLVDADALAYTAGFASQKVVYDWTVHRDGEVLGEGIASTRDEVEAVSVDAPEGATVDVVSVVDAEPLINALAMTKRTLLAIESAMDEAGVEFDRLELYLTGKGNFRESIATIKGYKANRVGMQKPVHYKAIRRYMKERWGALVVHGIEADDELATQAAWEKYDPGRVCIVSMDKDLRTVPGLLYNFRRKQFYTITPQEALVNFYRQLLTGDTVDNIGGCFKCGEKRAAEVVNESLSEEQMYQVVLAEYVKSLERKGCPYVLLGAEDALLENARLLHLRRSPGEMWVPPSARDMKSPLQRVSGDTECSTPTSRTSTASTSPK